MSHHNEFIEDIALGKSSRDLLNQEHYAKDIAQRINSSTFQQSFAIGITGSWGTGKTSFMNLIRRHLEHDKKILIDFNPWSSQTPNLIIIDFFNALRSSFRERDYNMGSMLIEYANNLADSSDNVFIKSLSVFKDPKSVEEQYSLINDSLKRIDRQIVIFIDDLDRLDENELKEVMKLIRNTASFYNVVFIVAYDRNYLINAVKKINSHKSEFFLEKIFQIEISLPAIERKLLLNQLFETIKLKVDDDWHNELKDLIFGAHFAVTNPFLGEYIVTMRDVVRFTNSFSMNWTKLKGEVLFSELFNLELLRFKFPSVYELLIQKKDLFFEAAQEGLNKYVYKFKVENTESTLLKFLESNSDELSINPNHFLQIKALLEEVFPSRHTFEKNKRHLSVRYPSNFEKYFAIRLLEGNISEIEFSKSRNSNQTDFNNFIQATAAKGLSLELRNRFEQINSFDSREDFQKVITGIFALANCPAKEGWISENVGYSPEDFANKLYNSSQIAKKFYDGSSEELKRFILLKFENAEYPYFVEGDIVKGWREKMFDDRDPIFKVSDLENINLTYFKGVTTNETELNSIVWWSFHDCWMKGFVKDEGLSSYSSMEYYIPGATQLFISFIRQTGLEKFLSYIVTSNLRSENHFHVWENMVDVFGSWTAFEFFLDEFDENERPYLKEFKVFFALFKQKGFRESIEFQFHELKIRNTN